MNQSLLTGENNSSKVIYICAFAANPNFGSEFAVGWNIPLELARNSDHQIFVFIGTYQGKGFGKFEGLDENHIPSNLSFIKVFPNKKTEIFNFFNEKLKLKFMFYLALRSWNKEVLKQAKKLSMSIPPDITHQLGPIGFREPGYLYKLNKRHIWGPIGGCIEIQLKSLKHINFYFIKSVLKNYINFYQAFSRRIYKASLSTSDLIFATRDNYENLKSRIHVRKAHFMSESAISKTWVIQSRPKKKSKKLKCLIVGSIDHRKNVIFCIDLFKSLDPSQYELTIVGKGPLEKKIIEIIKNENLKHIHFKGSIPRNEIIKFYQESDVMLLPSNAEGNPNVVWESMSQLLPVMAFRRNGMASSLKRGGILIEPESYVSNLNSWKYELTRLKNNPDILHRLRDEVKKEIGENLWENRAETILNIYEKQH